MKALLIAAAAGLVLPLPATAADTWLEPSDFLPSDALILSALEASAELAAEARALQLG